MILPAARTLKSLKQIGIVPLTAAIALPDEPKVACGRRHVDLDDAHPYHRAMAMGVTAGVDAGLADRYVTGVAPSAPGIVRNSWGKGGR